MTEDATHKNRNATQTHVTKIEARQEKKSRGRNEYGD